MKKRCVIIGASPETDAKLLTESVCPEDYIICADGGYVFAQQAGLVPDVIIGDFDSSPCPEDCSCEIIRLPVKKDDTDTHYAAREGIRRGFSDFLLAGMTGGRADHTMANFSTMLFLKNQGASSVLVDNSYEASVLQDESFTITGKSGSGFAVFPFGCTQCCASLEGFEYNLDRGTLTADFPIGVSNRIISGKACVTIHSGTAIIFIIKNCDN